jgi:diguanylate cyclase (GGDEF)-like protein
MRIEALFRALRSLSSDLDLVELIPALLHAATSLFPVLGASVWLRTPGRLTLQLAGSRGLHGDLAAGGERVGHDSGLVSLGRLAEERPIVMAQPENLRELDETYAAHGIGSVVVLPLVSRGEVMGALVLYGRTSRALTDGDLELGVMFAHQVASVIAGSLLLTEARSDTARLRAVQDLAWRLNRIQDINGIGEAIMAEADNLIEHDTMRVYRIGTETGMCEPIAFQGEFLGIGRPSADQLRLRIGEGITGWVAAHNQTVRLADAAHDSRGRRVGDQRETESMLVVPMSWESRVLGVIVVSREGLDRFSEGDQRMLEVFASYAAQSMVGAEAFAELERQRHELANRLDRQHRLLEISEQLLATLEPTGVLGQIADSLGALITYDSLAIFRLDHAAGVRRAIVVRDPDAEAILAHTPPIEAGINGWAIARGEAVLANEAHVDPRAIQIPGTPVTPESLIVCPLVADGTTVGTLNVARMGADRQRFSPDEFELARLFATQASIAMRNAEAHGAVRLAAEHDPLTDLRNRGSFARDTVAAVERGQGFALLSLDLDHFKGFNDTLGHQAGDNLLVRIGEALREAVRGSDLAYRNGGDEFALMVPGASRQAAGEIAERVRAAIVATGVEGAPVVTASVGIALFPDDAASAADLVALADQAMYRAKRGPAGLHGR